MGIGGRAATLVFAVFGLMAPCFATAQALAIDAPGEGVVVQDLAGMIGPDDLVTLRDIGNRLRSEMDIPLIVVTIDSMAQYGGDGWHIESFARVLFEEWGFAHATMEAQSWRRAVLLLVSKNDRKARIELGADWAGAFDGPCQTIMNGRIIPAFKAGDFSGGIVAGVSALDRMCRGEVVEEESVGAADPTWPLAVAAILVGTFFSLLFVTLIRTFRTPLGEVGSSGTRGGQVGADDAYLGIGAAASTYDSGSSSTTSFGGDSGFSGGSDFGGGGGATGSW